MTAAAITTVPVLGPAWPSLSDVARAETRWHCWAGISGLLYAARCHASPPIVVRAEDPLGLLVQIRAEEARLRPYWSRAES
jgi:hypothetical protein